MRNRFFFMLGGAALVLLSGAESILDGALRLISEAVVENVPYLHQQQDQHSLVVFLAAVLAVGLLLFIVKSVLDRTELTGAPREAIESREKDRLRVLGTLRVRYQMLLHQALAGDIWLDLGIAKWSDAPGPRERPPGGDVPGLVDAHQLHLAALPDCLSAAEGRLMILGGPRAGKSFALLHLARHLLDQAAKDPIMPLPIVLNLSSWSQRRVPIAEWLVDEFVATYHVRRTLAQRWVETDEIMPLLDGLDEVDARHRAACVFALNVYRREHPVVVASRIAEYEAQSTLLRLHKVELCSLSDAQIAQYLGAMALARPREQSDADGADGHAGAVEQTLSAPLARQVLADLTPTPTALRVLHAVWRDHVWRDHVWRDHVWRDHVWRGEVGRANGEEVASQSETATPLSLNLTEVGNAFFAAYVRHMLDHRRSSYEHLPTYSRRDEFLSERRWLGWLAAQLERHQPRQARGEVRRSGGPKPRHQAIFFLDRLGVDWLPRDDFLRRHVLTIGLTGAVLAAFIAVVASMVLPGPISALVYGLIIGIAVGWTANGELRPARAVSWSWWRAGVGLICGLVIGPTGGLALWFFIGLLAVAARVGGKSDLWIESLLRWLRQRGQIWLLLLLALVVLAGLAQPQLIFIVAPNLDPSQAPSTRAIDVIFRVLAALALALLVGFLPQQRDVRDLTRDPGEDVSALSEHETREASGEGLSTEREASPLEALRRSVIAAFHRPGGVISRPNPRVWQSGLNGLVAALGAMLLVGLANTLTGVSPQTLGGLYAPFLMGCVGGIALAISGGMAVVQHAVIRAWLASHRLAPWNYPRFLEYAADHALVEPVQGGYRFVCVSLQAHLAAWYRVRYSSPERAQRDAVASARDHAAPARERKGRVAAYSPSGSRL